MSERRFTDEQMNAIIKRAGALQLEGSADRTVGTSLSQIQQAASELGISPDYVNQAVDELAIGQQQKSWALLGGPTRAQFCRVAQGTFAEQDIPGLIKEIRRLTGRVGSPKSLGPTFEWISTQPDGLLVSLTQREQSTEIVVDASFGQWIGLCLVMPLVISFAISAAVFAELGPILGGGLALILLATAFSVGRSIFKAVSASRQKAALTLVEELKAAIESAPERRPTNVASDVSQSPRVHQTLIG